MKSEGPYHIRNGPFDSYKRIEGPTVVYSRLGEIDYALDALNDAYAEGRKSKEKELEEKKAREDAILYGTGFMEGRKRVKPEHVYLSDAEIKLKKKKAAQDFQELLELADRMCDKMDEEFYYVAREFYDWKKARGIE